MLLPELQQLAAGLGINTTKMRKSDLVAAIQNRQAAVSSADGHATRAEALPPRSPVAEPAIEIAAPAESALPRAQEALPPANGARQERRALREQPSPTGDQRGPSSPQSGTQSSAGPSAAPVSQQPAERDDETEGGRRRGRRYRDRRGRNRDRSGPPASGSGSGDAEPTVSDDDVVIPVAGILDAVEEKNTWFVRTAGYFASPEDIYVANSYVRRFGLRRGDAVTGAIRQPRDGERREKYNPLVRLDTVNGRDPEASKNRLEFTKLTPLYPQTRLRLETEPHLLTTRVIDLVMPIGKGQRALIVSPPKAGKTMVLQAIANAITVNNPECHLMVVLVDERPEEVTDMQRSVKGEVISSTFDRRPQDHTMVAELSIERAKRLVEMGHDVVVLLDSITRLGRAYNLAAPASGRILSGGVDSTALYQPKRFLGAARNIENGGSLTILATALVETGSAGDTVFFEEYKGTGNAELKLDRKIADKRVFPAIDVDQSSTRKEEILLSPDELAVVIKLRRVLHALEPQQAIDLLLDRLKKTRTNVEFLMQIAKTTPGQD
jgi:transcription termination factor Rho